MPPRDIPLTLEKRRIQVNAFGIRSEKQCETDNYDCCETGTGTSGIAEEMCCPDNALITVLDASIVGPLGKSESPCIIDLTLILKAGSFAWEGEARETTEDCDGVEIFLKLWCIKDEFGNLYWMTSGIFTSAEADTQPFGPEALEDFGDGSLVTNLSIPGYLTQLEIAIQKPCVDPIPPGPTNCVDISHKLLNELVEFYDDAFTPNPLWVIVNVPAGTYHITTTGSGAITVQWCTDCDTGTCLGSHVVYVLGGCEEFTNTIEGGVLLVSAATVMASSWKIEAGPCP